MRSRTFAGRMFVTGLAASVTALSAGATAGSAATGDGVGTSTVTTSVLDATLGDLLGLTMLQDVASSTTDPKAGSVGASSVFRQLKTTSTVDALDQVVGEHTVKAPDGPTDLTTSIVTLDTPLNAVVSGSLEPVVLKALGAPNAATQSTASITELGLLGGLAGVRAVDAVAKTGSGPAASEAGRTMNLEALTLLQLGQLLQGLGLEVVNLPLSVVSALVTSLGIPVDLRGATDLATLVTALGNAIEALRTADFAVIDPVLLAALGTLGVPPSLLPALDSPTEAALNTVTEVLTNLINSVVTLIDETTLLEVSGLDITTLAKAAGTVAGSAATATGTVGSVKVGSVTIPGTDTGAAAGAVDALVAQIEGTLATALGPLGFTDLLSVQLFDRQTGVTETGGVVKALSSITGLVVDLTPPSLDVLTPLNPPDGGIETLIPPPTQSGRVSRSGLVAAAAPNPLTPLLGDALGEAPLLSQGLELRVGTVQSQSLQSIPATTPNQPVVPASPTPAAPTPAAPTPATATPPMTELPRTGAEHAKLGLLALVLGAAALGARRLRRNVQA